MTRIIGYLFGLFAVIFSHSTFALTDLEIEQRFKAYEEKIKSLEEKIESGSGSTSSDKKLKKQVKKNKKKMKSLVKKIAAEKERFQINGFITAAASKADEKLGTDYHFNDRVNFRGDSKVGLQFNYKLTDITDVTIQMVARSRDSDTWNVDAEWAYIGHNITDWMKVRMGRLRIPFYLYSESLDVGFSYPWVRPPVDLYTTAITSFDGIDAVFKVSTGPIRHRMQLWAAAWTNTDSESAQSIDIYDTYGFNITSSWQSITARLATTQLKIEGSQTVERFDEVPSAFLPTIAAGAGGAATCNATNALNPANCSHWNLVIAIEDSVYYHSAALQYDDGSFFLIYEGAVLRLRDDTLFGDSRTRVFSAGYRYGNWTPYLTAGKDNSDEAAVSPIKTQKKSRSFGLRYNLNASTALTVEWNRFYDFKGTSGFSAEALDAGETDLDDASIYTLSVDAVF